MSLWRVLKSQRSLEDTLQLSDNNSPNLTFVFNQSKWGEKWTEGKPPDYNTIDNLSKHITSLGALGLKTFTKLKMPHHASHFIPQNNSEQWLAQLIMSLTRFTVSNEEEFVVWEKLLEYSFTSKQVPYKGKKEKRTTGQLLLKLLMEMQPLECEGTDEQSKAQEKEKVLISPLYTLFYWLVYLFVLCSYLQQQKLSFV